MSENPPSEAASGMPLFWRTRLDPDERLLWSGRPSRGLNVFCIEPGEAFSVVLQIGIAVFVLRSLNTHDPNALALGKLVAVAAALLAIGLPVARALRLRNSRYAVTDRRSIVVAGVFGPTVCIALPHDASTPRRVPELWGETVFVGRRFHAAPDSWQKGIGWMGGSSWQENLQFHRLDPADSPLELLQQLQGGADVPLSARAVTMTGGQL